MASCQHLGAAPPPLAPEVFCADTLILVLSVLVSVLTHILSGSASRSVTFSSNLGRHGLIAADRLGVAAMVEGALDLVVFCMFASVCDFGHEAYNIVWPPAHHSRDWHEVLSISRLLVVVSALFLGNVALLSQRCKCKCPNLHHYPHLGNP